VDRFGIIKRDTAPKELSTKLQKELEWIHGHNAAVTDHVVPQHVSAKADKCVTIAQKLISSELVQYDRYVVACGVELMKHSDDMINSMYAWIIEPLNKINPRVKLRPKPTAAEGRRGF